MQANSIPEVIRHLDKIIEECKTNNTRIGYFACLYRKMTIAVQNGLVNNLFANPLLMEKLDVVFANRYLEAYNQYKTGSPTTRSWKFVFDESKNKNIILQHLLLGINTHINLDLSIATAQVTTADIIQDFQSDFNKINDTISSLIYEVQTDLGEVFLPMRLIKKVNTQQLDSVINFSIGLARKSAWANALTMSLMPNNGREEYIKVLDVAVLQIAKNIAHPNFSTTILIKIIQWFESNNIQSNINLLHD